MRVVIRVDASLQIGSGHVMRCLTLAQTLKNNRFEVVFICRKLHGHLIEKIAREGFHVHELSAHNKKNNIDSKLDHSHWLEVTQKNDADDCITILNNEEFDWLIVDHYALDHEWQNCLKPHYKRLMVIDDLADRNHQCDILLDQTYGRIEKDYLNRIPMNGQLLLGSKYALLRPEFSDFRISSLKRRTNSTLNNLLINMGGIDIENVTEEILDHLKASNLGKELNITIVMGIHSPHLESIKIKASELSQNTKLLVDVQNMAEIMADADIAIGASGSTTWERCCLGLPSIQIAISKNQKHLAQMLADKNVIRLVKEIKEIINLLESAPTWMNNTGSLAAEICDGAGSNRVFNKMTNRGVTLKDFGEIILCNYTNLNRNDISLALEMRNHEKIRAWMYHQNLILKDEHLNFIANLETRYFLVKQKDAVIGSINFSKIRYGSSVDFGIYINPFIKTKGLGILLESAASDYAFNELDVEKINLEVFEHNKKAINFYKRCGFNFINSTIIEDQTIICMEKKRFK
jgi:UDP-2,4-diacetamido-2,4,6-trideoxy-beta-L-altropyranose hydrolase